MRSSKPVRVLVTGAGTATAISVLKGLRSQCEVPVRVTAADSQGSVAGAYLADDFVRVPSATDPTFAHDVEDICKRWGIDLVIPIVDPEFLPLAEAAEDFLANRTRVAISSPRAISICGDKVLQAQFLKSLGLPVAKIHELSKAMAGDVPFPLFVKPRRGARASIGAQRVDDLKELEVATRDLDTPLVQEFIEGPEYTIDTFSDFEGRFIAAMPRIRLETKAGVSVKGRTVDEPELVAAARTITQALPIIGPSNIQCFRRPDGSFIVSEVNPRFSGGLALSVAAGLSSPLLLLKLVRGETVDASQLTLRYGVTMVRYWQEVFTYDGATVDADPWPPWNRRSRPPTGANLSAQPVGR